MSLQDRPTLDCQECGAVVRYLDWDEARKVANDPYALIAYCTSCGEALMKEIEKSRRSRK